jgi:hypothetical protein
MFIKKEGAYDAILLNATPYHQPRCSLFLWISIPVWVTLRPVAGVLSIYLNISTKKIHHWTEYINPMMLDLWNILYINLRLVFSLAKLHT